MFNIRWFCPSIFYHSIIELSNRRTVRRSDHAAQAAGQPEGRGWPPCPALSSGGTLAALPASSVPGATYYCGCQGQLELSLPGPGALPAPPTRGAAYDTGRGTTVSAHMICCVHHLLHPITSEFSPSAGLGPYGTVSRSDDPITQLPKSPTDPLPGRSA
eukprot:432887-Hanusia_phi.AAC.2